MTFLTDLQCSYCDERYDADTLRNLCPSCGKPLFARYDLVGAKSRLDRDEIQSRPEDLWRYRELLPIRDTRNILNLGEGFTPLVHATRLESELGFHSLYIKDEGLNPTGSFKARGLSLAVSKAKELGVRALSIPSAGNAAGAMSAYAALGGMESHVFMPADVPQPFITECEVLGASVTLVDGVITDCARIAAEQNTDGDRFDVSTLKEPYRLEGKKTMGYEICEQLGWEVPDVIIYPTGGGTGLVGMWKAFDELQALGWIDSKRPRMVTVQAQGCAPIVRAFHEGTEFAEPWEGAATVADGLRVPAAIGDFLMLNALRASSGTAVTVPDDAMLEAVNTLGRTQGIFACPESGASLAAFEELRSSGWIENGERVVIFNKGSGHKYAHLWSGSSAAD